MTEEEFTQVYLLGYTDRASEKDYDPMKHYSSRTCGDCNHLQEYSAKLWKTIGVCGNESCSFLDCKVTDTDGCNKWSAKDD